MASIKHLVLLLNKLALSSIASEMSQLCMVVSYGGSWNNDKHDVQIENVAANNFERIANNVVDDEHGVDWGYNENIDSLDSLGDAFDDEDDIWDRQTGHGQQWIILGALYQASLPCEELGITKGFNRDTLSEGSTFMDKERLKTALGLYHLVNRVEFIVERSDKCRFSVVCKYSEQCPFLLRATTHGTVWKVIKWVAPHSCQIDLRNHGPRTVLARTIRAFFAPTLMNEGAVLKPKEMQAQLRREYGFVVDYQMALIGRNHAISMIYGDTDKSFQLLPSYLYMLQESNPGSIVALQTDSVDRFQYAFMAIGACVNGFKSSCRPVIVVDGTHLKVKYRGIMFVAATKDGNE
ncbi:uncharacterized protein LOC131004175 [Salvia miltiorrhiza]|uniref:uncharacterized protein LOC131004175 n=1 Tax=Salvia miltiorrhiza TaxID=226208 RepID=UPI0025ACA8D0|nr:uncharacterized protein LOC131004175 [Salvia miltiorrhiza]